MADSNLLLPGVYAITCRCGDYLTIEEPGRRNPYMVHTILEPAEVRRLMVGGHLVPVPPDPPTHPSRRLRPASSGPPQLELL